EARPCAAHGLEDAQAGQLRGTTDEGDLPRALHRAEGVEGRRQVADLGTGMAGAEELDELALAGQPAIEGVRGDGPVRLLDLVTAFGPALGRLERRAAHGGKAARQSGEALAAERVGAEHLGDASQRLGELDVG